MDRLDPFAGMTTAEINTMLLDVHRGPLATQARQDTALGFDDTRSWVDPNGYRLSDRLWNQRAAVRKAIDDRLRLGISRGEDALTVARDLEGYLNPAYRPTRTRNGRIVDDGRRGVTTRAPYRGGQGSYAARRLARTEVTRAFGQTTDAAAVGLELPVKWNLSNRHPEADECDENAQRSSAGLPPGVYHVRECPQYPNHPHCLCTKSVHDERSEDDLVAYLRQKYDLPETGVLPGGRPAIPGTVTPPTATVDTEREDRIREARARRRAERAIEAQAEADRIAAEQSRAERRRLAAEGRARRAAEAKATAEANALGMEARAIAKRGRVKWKPEMPRAEAEAFASQGVLTRPLYHVTSPEGAAGIAADGFDLSRSKWGRVWGNGAYMSDTAASELMYSRGFANPTKIELRVQSRKTLTVDLSGRQDYGHNAILEAVDPQAQGKYTAQLQRVRAANDAVTDPFGRYDPFASPADRKLWADRREHAIEAAVREGRYVYDVGAEALTRTLRDDYGYDVLEIIDEPHRDTVGGSQVIVFDPKRVTVVKD